MNHESELFDPAGCVAGRNVRHCVPRFCPVGLRTARTPNPPAGRRARQRPVERHEADTPAAGAVQGQVGNPSHGSAYLGIRADDQKDRGRGVRVLDVNRGSPADKAGLRRQDLITAVAGVRVRQMTDMADILDTFVPGQGVDFDLLREGGSERAAGDIGRTSGRGRAAVGPARGHSAAARRSGCQSARTAGRAAPLAAAVGCLISRRDIPHRAARTPHRRTRAPRGRIGAAIGRGPQEGAGTGK